MGLKLILNASNEDFALHVTSSIAREWEDMLQDSYQTVLRNSFITTLSHGMDQGSSHLRIHRGNDDGEHTQQ